MASDSMQDPLGKSGNGRRSSTNLLPERAKTDDGLREEREKTDQVVAARHEDMARHADAMVHHARNTADAVLTAARENADAVLDAARDKADARQALGSGNMDQAALHSERAVADSALQHERDSADEILGEERAAYANTLLAFLPLEREFTDHSLQSERIRADEALVNRDDFLAIVAHDLRNLLGGIVLSAKVIEKRARQDQARVSTLMETERIGRYTARMGRLIGDLVDIASIDAGKLAVALIPGDLGVLIAESVDAFQSAAQSRGITLAGRVDTASLAAAFDHDRILQVLGNLISNALKFTPQGGTVTLVGERDDNDVQLTVSDTGSGIPEEELGWVFERFTQVGASTHGGLGLGLYISRCLVEAHGGSIRAESKLGAGTRVCLRLPATS